MNEEPRPLSKMQKMYFLKLMSGLDREGKLGNGCFIAKEGPHNMHLYQYPVPGMGKGADLLALSSDEEIDRFSFLEPLYLTRGVDRFVVGRTIYSPTELGRERYYKLIDDEIIHTVEQFWNEHPWDDPGLVSIRRHSIGKGSISVSLETFTSRIKELVQTGRVIDYTNERPTEIGTARLYLPPVAPEPAANSQTLSNVTGTQNNVGGPQFNAGGNINIYNGSGTNEREDS